MSVHLREFRIVTKNFWIREMKIYFCLYAFSKKLSIKRIQAHCKTKIPKKVRIWRIKTKWSLQTDRQHRQYLILRPCELTLKNISTKFFFKNLILNNSSVDEGSLKRTEVSTPIPMEYSTCVESRGEIWIISGDYGDCYKFDGQSFSSCGYTYVGHRKVWIINCRK